MRGLYGSRKSVFAKWGGFATPYGMREFSPHQKRERKIPPLTKKLLPHQPHLSLCCKKSLP